MEGRNQLKRHIALTLALCAETPVGNKHYPNPKSIEDRFWTFVRKGDGCWIWAGAMTDRGYGKLNGGPLVGNVAVLAHRISYAIHCGFTPENMEVCHKCDNPSCVNPGHLFLGTRLDNSHDARKKGRIVREERHSCAKLTKRKVKAIRNARASGTRYKHLAARFGVSESTIGDVITGRTWKGPR